MKLYNMRAMNKNIKYSIALIIFAIFIIVGVMEMRTLVPQSVVRQEAKTANLWSVLDSRLQGVGENWGATYGGDKVNNLESLMYVPQNFNTAFDGDPQTSDLLRKHFRTSEWKEASIKRLGLTMRLPRKVWSYANLAEEGCERELVIEDEDDSSSTPTSFLIMPSTQSCDSKESVVSHDGATMQSDEAFRVYVLHATNLDEVRGFLKGLITLSSHSTHMSESCALDSMTLIPISQMDGFEYEFLLSAGDEKLIHSESKCAWKDFRPHVKYDPVRREAIIMENYSSGFWHPKFQLEFSGGRTVTPTFNRIIFESIVVN
jgi:hypothetical protein